MTVADGTNLGLARMAAASQGVTRDQLVWMKDAYVREDGYHRALAILIDAHARLPIASTWGTGTTSRSDGQFFRGGKRMAVGDINARYGVDPGFSFYPHVSDQHAPYHVTVISAATHEAPYVLDGLLHHGSSLRIGEHYTDTGGATDHVFALCAMLGFRFCPRLRDFPDRRLATLGHVASYPAIGSLIGKRVKTDTIREHWGEVLRLVASLKAGHVAPSAMLRRLAAYERQNQVDFALQEIGRIERTFFMLDWLEPRSSPTLPGRPQQERAASRSDAGDLHLPSGPDHRPGTRDATTSRVRAEPGDSRDRLLELHLYHRCRPASPLDRRVTRPRASGPHLSGRVGAYCVFG